MNHKLNIKKIILTIVLIFLICTGGFLLLNFSMYQQTSFSVKNILSDKNLKDFSKNGEAITSTSADPFITLSFDKKIYVKTVEIDIHEINSDDISAEIIAVGNNWDRRHLILSNGKNTVSFPGLCLDSKVFLRLDLTEKPDVSMVIGDVIINGDKARILFSAFCESLCLTVLLSLIYLILTLHKTSLLREKSEAVLRHYFYFIEHSKNNESLKKGLFFVLKCSFFYILSITAIIRANFLYIDDLGRNYSGGVNDWDGYNRFFSKAVCKLMSASNIVSDTSPLPQIMTMFLMAAAVTIIIWAIAPEKLTSNWMIAAALPFAVSPYFMENISYKIESIIHGVSILLCIIPLLLYKKRNFIYLIFTACCTALMCITYQSATAVFPIVIVLLASMEWNSGENLKRTWKLVYTSILGYGIGLAFFKIFIMRPVQTHVSSNMLPVRDLIPGFFRNLLNFYSTIYKDFSKSWLIIIFIIIVLFIIVYSLNSKRNIKASFVMAITTIMLMGSLCFGIYPVLQECVYLPRSMYGFCIAVSLLCIFITAKGFCMSRLSCFALAWGFFTFSFTYGNCLYLQQEYTNMRMQAVFSYLNERYQPDQQYQLQIIGDIGEAPSIKNKTSSHILLDKLVPRTLSGGWMWSEYSLYQYYGLPENYSVIWASQSFDENYDLRQKNLPLAQTTMWFDVYSDGSNILIDLKQS